MYTVVMKKHVIVNYSVYCITHTPHERSEYMYDVNTAASCGDFDDSPNSANFSCI